MADAQEQQRKAEEQQHRFEAQLLKANTDAAEFKAMFDKVEGQGSNSHRVRVKNTRASRCSLFSVALSRAPLKNAGSGSWVQGHQMQPGPLGLPKASVAPLVSRTPISLASLVCEWVGSGPFGR